MSWERDLQNDRQLEEIIMLLHENIRLQKEIMALVEIEQSDLDGWGQSIAAAVNTLQVTLSNLNQPLAPADETAVKAAIAGLVAVAQPSSGSTLVTSPTVATPVTDPVTTPEPPVVTDTTADNPAAAETAPTASADEPTVGT
jgi:hypothetical protein